MLLLTKKIIRIGTDDPSIINNKPKDDIREEKNNRSDFKRREAKKLNK